MNIRNLFLGLTLLLPTLTSAMHSKIVTLSNQEEMLLGKKIKAIRADQSLTYRVFFHGTSETIVSSPDETYIIDKSGNKRSLKNSEQLRLTIISYATKVYVGSSEHWEFPKQPTPLIF